MHGYDKTEYARRYAEWAAVFYDLPLTAIHVWMSQDPDWVAT